MNNFRAYLLFIISLSLFVISCEQKNENKLTTPETIKKMSIGIQKLEHFPKSCSIRAIAPLDKNTCWYAGSGGQFGYTEDGGKTWFVDSIQHTNQPELAFRSIAHAGPNTFLLSIASPALLYKTSDKGRHWKIVYQENDTSAFYDSMAFWDEEEGIAMGDPIGGCLSIIKTTDGGEKWNKIPCEQLPPSAEGEAAFAASNSNISLHGNNVWIVTGGKKARVFHSADRGTTWSVYKTPIIDGGKMTGIFGCDFYDDKTGIVIGGDWEKKELNKGNKAISSDGGKTWKLIADGVGPSYRSCVQFIGDSPKEIIAVGIPGISFSSDGGKQWKKLSDESFYTVRKAGNALWFGGADKMGRLVY